jgi:hypothetical protein
MVEADDVLLNLVLEDVAGAIEPHAGQRAAARRLAAVPAGVRLVRLTGAEPVIHMIVEADLLPHLVLEDGHRRDRAPRLRQRTTAGRPRGHPAGVMVGCCGLRSLEDVAR